MPLKVRDVKHLFLFFQNIFGKEKEIVKLNLYLEYQ